jgi:hypothetical protein
MYTSLQYGCQVMGACLQGVERKLCATLVCIQKGFAPSWLFAPLGCARWHEWGNKKASTEAGLVWFGG